MILCTQCGAIFVSILDPTTHSTHLTHALIASVIATTDSNAKYIEYKEDDILQNNYGGTIGGYCLHSFKQNITTGLSDPIPISKYIYAKVFRWKVWIMRVIVAMTQLP